MPTAEERPRDVPMTPATPARPRATMYTLHLALALLLLGPCLAEDRLLRFPLKAAKHLAGGLAARQRLKGDAGNLGGTPGEGYYVEMGVGTPPQKFNVLVDTGSSNFALAAAAHTDVGRYFNASLSSTFRDDGTEIFVPYTKGDWHGYLGEDVVTIPSLANVSIVAQFACIDESTEFYINGSEWQGILGMAYAEIARPDDSIIPFLDAVFEQTKTKKVFSLQMCGIADNTDAMGGTLIVGGIDKSLYRGDMQFSPILKEWYYEIVLADILVDDISLALPCKEYNFDKTIVDSGTTNLRLPNTVFTAATRLIQERTLLVGQQAPSEFWTGEDILCWVKGNTPWSAFPNLTLSVAASENSTFDLVVSPQHYLRPVQDEYDPLGADDCYKYAIVPSDQGAVIGAVAMEGFYVVFDRVNSQVGFAQTTCPSRDASAPPSVVSAVRHVSYNTTKCAYYKVDGERGALLLVAYVLAGFCGLCMLMLLGMMLQWQVKKCRARSNFLGRAPSNPRKQLLNAMES